MEKAPTVSIVLLSSELEKIHAAAMMGSVASMSGMTVNVFVSMDALEQFRKDVIAAKKFNVGTIGKTLMEKNVALFPNIIHDGVEMGNLHLYGCAMALDVMGWKKEDLIDDFEEIIGVTKFFMMAEGGQIMTL